MNSLEGWEVATKTAFLVTISVLLFFACHHSGKAVIEANNKKYLELSVVERLKQELKKHFQKSPRDMFDTCETMDKVDEVFGVEGEK